MDTTQIAPTQLPPVVNSVNSVSERLSADRLVTDRSIVDRSIAERPIFEQWMKRAEVMTEEGDHFTAVEIYDQIIDLQPDYAAAYGERALLRANLLGDPQGAIADLRQAAALFLSQGKTLNYEIVMNYMRSMHQKM